MEKKKRELKGKQISLLTKIIAVLFIVITTIVRLASGKDINVQYSLGISILVLLMILIVTAIDIGIIISNLKEVKTLLNIKNDKE